MKNISITIGLLTASASLLSAGVISTDFGWVSTTTVSTDTTTLTDTPTNTNLTLSSSDIDFSHLGGTNATTTTGGSDFTSTITISFDKEITSLSLTLSDYDKDGATVNEFMTDFSILPTSLAGNFEYRLTGGPGVNPTGADSAGTLIWTALPSGTTSISYTHNRLLTTLGVHFEEITATTVPEPSASLLLGLGGLALIMRRRK